MTQKDPAQLADDAAEAIRAINHLTLTRSAGDGSWGYPSHVYRTVGSLSRMAMMLPQALEQDTRFIADLNESGHLRSDRGQLEEDLSEVFHGLDEARIAAERLYGALSRAHSGLAHLGYTN
jgi:hypothetical protein